MCHVLFDLRRYVDLLFELIISTLMCSVRTSYYVGRSVFCQENRCFDLTPRDNGIIKNRQWLSAKVDWLEEEDKYNPRNI